MPFADIDRNRSAYARPFEGPIFNETVRARLFQIYEQHTTDLNSGDTLLHERECADHFSFTTVGYAANRAVSAISYLIADRQVRRRCHSYHLEVKHRYYQATAHSHLVETQNA